MLRVTPLYGSYGHNPASASLSIPPSSTLVEYGGVRVLVNVGWDESYPLLDGPVATAAAGGGSGEGEGGGADPIPPASLPDVDAIVIADSTLASLGGLPIYLGRRGRARRAAAAAAAAAATSAAATGGGSEAKADDLPAIPPIYGTYPTLKMGQMTLYDYHATQCLDGRDPGFDLADVDELFAEGRHFRPLKYSQTLSLPLPVAPAEAGPKRGGGTAAAAAAAAAVVQQPPLLGITPHRAGHVTGGAFYVLRRLSDETEVVVAPGNAYHHAKERHLDGATLHKFGAAADVLVTSPGGSGGLLGSLYRPPSSGGKAVLANATVSRRETELVSWPPSAAAATSSFRSMPAAASSSSCWCWAGTGSVRGWEAPTTSFGLAPWRGTPLSSPDRSWNGWQLHWVLSSIRREGAFARYFYTIVLLSV